MIPTHVQIVGKDKNNNEVSYIAPRDKITLLQKDVAAIDPTIKPTNSYSAFIERSGNKSIRVSMEYSDWLKASCNLRQKHYT